MLRHSALMAKPALGRGLGALLGGVSPGVKPAPAPDPAAKSLSGAAVDTREKVERIPLSRIRPCPFQPRKSFSDESLRELADSIREQGVLQPLIVRPQGDHFELIAGERRWRAAQLLAMAEVPALVREADDRKVLELALIENLQRENLNPIEEGLGYSQLIEQFRLTQEEVAVRVGKSRAAVANSLRLLKLPPPVLQNVRSGMLSVSHAKVLLGLPKSEDQASASEQVLKDNLNVRQTEAMVAGLLAQTAASAPGKPKQAPLMPDVHIRDLQNRLQEKLGTKVALRYKHGKGAVEIHFFNDDDLDRVLEIIGVKAD